MSANANRMNARDRVAALAGRRIDAANADHNAFPLARVPSVEAELRDLFSRERVTALVCSAACGADLLALRAAPPTVRRRIVLPFEPLRFRSTSVVDRPGGWGPIFDNVIDDARAHGDLVILDDRMLAEDDAYAEATRAIIREARALAKGGRPPLAVLVWEGAHHEESPTDATDDFRRLAEAAGFELRLVRTI